MGTHKSGAVEWVYAGGWGAANVYLFSTMTKDVPNIGAHLQLNGTRAFTRGSASLLQPTVVVCTYDEEARTLRMEIADEPYAGVLTFPPLPSAEFLCPIVLLNDNSLAKATVSSAVFRSLPHRVRGRRRVER
jgi:hypothetical protein